MTDARDSTYPRHAKISYTHSWEVTKTYPPFISTGTVEVFNI